MTTFILIRHAESPRTEDEGRPLSPAGFQAAEALPARLADLPIDAIYSSPYRRARQTIEPLARQRGLPIGEDPALREIALPSLSAGSLAEVMTARWADFDLTHRGGESNRQAQERVVGLVRTLAQQHPVQSLALATHGNLLALLLHSFDPGVGPDLWRSLTFPDVYVLRLQPPSTGVFRRIAV